MLPELFRIPFIDFPIYTYGVLLATGILLGIWLAARNAALDGLDKGTMYSFALRVVIASLIGAKLLLLFTEWNSFGDWRNVFSMEFIRAGGVYYGGFLAGLAMAAYLVWRHKLSGWRVADAFAPGIALGQFVGRLGCFAAGCCWGRSTTSWVGVEFTPPAHEQVGVPIGVHLHPTQLYESAATLLIFGFLMWLRPRRAYPGQVVLTYILLYATARFIVEFYRGDWRGWVGPLSTSQFIALVLAAASLTLLIAWRKRGEQDLRLQTSDLRP
ncbi:MAG: prolipoprotein diacylglyceryl transferase [Acidobacteria bacterium]|nr:prolipoprotein diacylglyceryl transferase [Acidobacteriota bacterium]